MQNKSREGIIIKRIILALLVCFMLLLSVVGWGEANNVSNNSLDSESVSDLEYKSIESNKYNLAGSANIFEHIMFPAIINDKKLMLEMTIDRPDDNKQYPVLILTHGRHGPYPENNPNTYEQFKKVNWRFLKEKLIVVHVVRRGFGLSEGSVMDEYKTTPIASGREMVKDIEQALLYMKAKPYVIKNKFVVGGHSQGGWAALVAASANLDGVVCIINFSGATNYSNAPRGAGWQSGANADMSNDCIELGKAATIPSLWIYGDAEPNRTVDETEKMFSEYTNAGGKAKLILLPGIHHDTISPNAQDLWAKQLHEFLIENRIVNASL